MAAGWRAWYQHVRGHTGDVLNEEQDHWAKEHLRRPGLFWRARAHEQVPHVRRPPPHFVPPAPPAPEEEEHEEAPEEEPETEDEGELEEITLGSFGIRRRPGLQTLFYRTLRAAAWLVPRAQRPARPAVPKLPAAQCWIQSARPRAPVVTRVGE